MRILQIAPPWFSVPPEGYGGTEEIVSLLTEKLVTAGHEVTLLAAGGSRSGARLWTTFSEPPSGLLGDAAVELAHVMRGHRCRSQFDVIHDHTRGGAALGAVPGGPPVVHTLHGRWTTSDAMLYRELAESVALVAISHDQAARAPADVRVAAVVHNGIDVDRYPLATARGDHLAYLGRATADKGPDLAIEIARRLGRTLRMAIKVNEADERAYFGEVIAPMLADAGADVELVPVTTQAEKTAFLGAAAAVLFPIRWPEPFGLVPVEANACGTPVVAFANGAVPEVVEDGRSGFVVEPDDLDAFCRAVERVDELDPATCRASVTARFHADRMVQGYLNVYHRLVEGAHRPPAAPADLSCRPLHTLERRTESLRMERLATSKRVIAGPEHAISRPGS